MRGFYDYNTTKRQYELWFLDNYDNQIGKDETFKTKREFEERINKLPYFVRVTNIRYYEGI